MTKNADNENEIKNLILKAQNNDSKAMEQLIRKVQKQVYAMFFHLANDKNDVSDLTQEALLKMAKNIKQLKNINTFKQWLNKIITNTFYDYTRKNSNKFVEIDEKELNKIKDKIGCEPGEKCFFTEIETLIKSALLTLPQTLRLSLILREFEGLSYEDISRITNTTLGTVKSRISRARLKLQQELKGFI